MGLQTSVLMQQLQVSVQVLCGCDGSLLARPCMGCSHGGPRLGPRGPPTAPTGPPHPQQLRARQPLRHQRCPHHSGPALSGHIPCLI